MLKYFDDFIGKNLGIEVFGELMMYFSINMVPMALPLAILVASLMTYGQLGEHFELTAIKSAGISLTRVLLPTLVFTVILSIGAYFFNNTVVPKANLDAYSLLYDIKQKKPALDLKEGQFYNGIPDFSIKVGKKYKDEINMNDVIIYDHSENKGNNRLILADSCRMYTFINDRYLMMELYDGNYYLEEEKKNEKKSKSSSRKKAKSGDPINQIVRTKFDRMDLVFSLASFDLKDTDKNLFAGNRYMKSTGALTASVDSMSMELLNAQFKLYNNIASSYQMHMGGYIEPTQEIISAQLLTDSLNRIKSQALQDSIALTNNDHDTINHVGSSKVYPDTRPAFTRPSSSSDLSNHVFNNEGDFTSAQGIYYVKEKKESKIKKDTLFLTDKQYETCKHVFDSIYLASPSEYKEMVTKAANSARNIKSTLSSSITRFSFIKSSIDSHVVEKHKKYAMAFSCIVMFLIGAPLGAIIKRGGLGLPIIIGILFFIVFYVLTSAGDKWAKSGVMDGFYAAWIANVVLLPFGLVFLKQARKDAKVFDADFYNVWFEKIKKWIEKRKKKLVET